MRSRADVSSEHAEALALRIGRHFAHKVLVESEHGVTRVHTRFGPFELEPMGDILRVRASADDAEVLARLEEVVVSHLGRFALGEELAVAWSREA